tara:strand:+ start:181 stop:681 length:501 start_codon:yes stop_codon:yes gene_type:complete
MTDILETFDIIDKNNNEFVKPSNYKNTNQSKSINKFDVFGNSDNNNSDTNDSETSDTDTNSELDTDQYTDESENDINTDLYIIHYNNFPIFADYNRERLSRRMLTITLNYIDIFSNKYPSHNIRIIKNVNGFSITKSHKFFLINYEEQLAKITMYKVKSNLKKPLQ